MSGGSPLCLRGGQPASQLQTRYDLGRTNQVHIGVINWLLRSLFAERKSQRRCHCCTTASDFAVQLVHRVP